MRSSESEHFVAQLEFSKRETVVNFEQTQAIDPLNNGKGRQ
jgi:hypothetical protein